MMDLGRRKTGKLMEKIIVQKLHEIEEKEHVKYYWQLSLEAGHGDSHRQTVIMMCGFYM